MVGLRVADSVEEVDIVVQVAVGDEDVRVAIIVVVEEGRPPGEYLETGNAQARLEGDVGEEALADVAVEAVSLPLIVGDEDVEQSVVIVVPHIHTHPGQRLAGVVVGHASQVADFAESATFVAIEEIRRAIAGDVEVQVFVLVIVDPEGTELLTHHRNQPDLLPYLGKRAVAVVEKELVRLRRERLRPAVDLDLFGTHTGLEGLGPEVSVVGRVEVLIAVAVDVTEGGTGRPAVVVFAFDARHHRNVREGAVAVVAEELVVPVAGHVEVQVTIPVVVADGAAQTVGVVLQAGHGGHVGESAVPVVVVESAGVLGTDEVEIEPAVAIVVEQRHPRSHRLGGKLPPEAAVLVDEVDPGTGGSVNEPGLRPTLGDQHPQGGEEPEEPARDAGMSRPCPDWWMDPRHTGLRQGRSPGRSRPGTRTAHRSRSRSSAPCGRPACSRTARIPLPRPSDPPAQ